MTASRHTLRFVFVTILLDAMSFGLIMPVLPRLLMRAGEMRLDQAISLSTWMGLAMALAAFFSAPLLGNLSDAVGRRPVLLIALAGMVVQYAVLTVADTVALIAIGRVLTGVFGGSYAPAQAAIADVTGPQERARNFGLVGAAFGVGFVAGPALGGLLSDFGERAPFVVALVLSAANLLYGLMLFPETLGKANRRPFALARANPFGAWRAARSAPGMVRLAFVLLAWQVASLVYPLTWSFWGIAQLGWSDRMIGLSLAGVGVTIALSQSFLTGPAVRRLGERDAAMIGILGATTAFVGYAFCTSTWLAFVLLVPVAVQSLVQPSLMSLLSRSATPQTQGEVQGLAGMMMGLGAIIAPLVLVEPMAWFTGPQAPVHFPGIAFVIAVAIALVAVLLLRAVPRLVATESQV